MNTGGSYLSCGVVLLWVAAASLAFSLGALLALIEAAQWLGFA